MNDEIRPVGTLESTATCWGVAALVGFATMGLLGMFAGWSILQAIFGGGVVGFVLGLVLMLTLARPTTAPTDMAGRMQTPTEDRARAEAAGQPGEAAAPPTTGRHEPAASPHRTEIPHSMISDTSGPDLNTPEINRAKPGTGPVIPLAAPAMLGDPTAHPVGATTAPKAQAQPTPLHGKVVSPEPPETDDVAPETPPKTTTRSVTPTPSPADEADRVESAPVAAPVITPAAAPKEVASSPADKVTARTASSAGTDAHAGTRSGTPTPSAADEADRVESAPGAGAKAGTEPKLLDAPRGGEADDLRRIKGIGPKLQSMLHDMGVFHFEQIASWTDKEIAWVDENLEGFRGRVSRDEWVAQARLLTDGGETDFSDRVDKGGVY